MSSRRTLKVASAIREVISMAILTDLKDPRVRDVTVTFVEVSPDLRQARVNVSVMGDETKQQLSLKGLHNAAGYLQQKIGQRIDTRYTPRIRFVLDQGVKRSLEVSYTPRIEFRLDQGVKHSLEVARILSEVLPQEPSESEEQEVEQKLSEESPSPSSNAPTMKPPDAD